MVIFSSRAPPGEIEYGMVLGWGLISTCTRPKYLIYLTENVCCCNFDEAKKVN